MLMSSSYAPAYQRYGSQIHAIHFIGPEKPWNAVPFRPPSLAENLATSSASSSGTTYDYQSLVDRWFAVYDKHYRSKSPAISPFQPKHYPSVWNSLSSTNPPDLLSSGSHFTLDDLRKMAIEGMSGAGLDNTSPSGQPGEGEYRSLPLEGRFDLMRPRKPSLSESDDDSLSISGPSLSPDLKMEMDYFSSERDLPVTPVPRHLGLPEDPDPVIWHTSPAPGPPKRSLPTTPMAISDYYASSAGQTSDEEGWDGPDSYTSSFPSSLFQQFSTSRPPSRSASHGQYLHPLDRGQDYSHHNNHEHHGSLHSFEQRDAGQAPNRGSRPSSLVQLSWNPAVEPPPSNFLPYSHIPADTSFTNAWDLQHQEHTRKGVASQASFPEQGPYRNAIGHASSGPSMSFGRSKAKSIFPWEDERRLRPSRVFPELDIPSSARFVRQTNPITPPTPKPLDRNRAEEHPLPSSIPKTLSFTNAWDGDRGIQNYASKLVRTPATHSNVDDWRGITWDEKVEASSQDGDDEDEGDENENDSEDNDTRRRARTRMISVVQKEVQKSGQKAYRSSGTQTIPREKRSQGVQKSTLTEVAPNQLSRRSSISGMGSLASGSESNGFQGHADSDSEILFKHDRFSATNGIRSRSVGSGPYGKSSLPSEHDRRPQRGVTMPSLSYPQRLPAGSIPSHVHEPLTVPRPPRASRPRLMSTPGKFVPPPKATRSSTQISSNAHPVKAPSISVLNDLPIGVPPSWIGLASTLEDRPPVRKGMRAWDPARGVELFKRGSEQVLARFLKMDSWDENDRGES